jgi:hypothetical protein
MKRVTHQAFTESLSFGVRGALSFCVKNVSELAKERRFGY